MVRTVANASTTSRSFPARFTVNPRFIWGNLIATGLGRGMLWLRHPQALRLRELAFQIRRVRA